MQTPRGSKVTCRKSDFQVPKVFRDFGLKTFGLRAEFLILNSTCDDELVVNRIEQEI